MRLRKAVGCLLAVGITVVVCGCGVFDQPGRLDNLDDANGNGFADVKAPRGISFDYESNLNVRFTNEISVSDLAQLVSGYNIDTSLLNLVDLTVTATFRLYYPGDIEDELTKTAEFAGFEYSYEVACPDSVDLNLKVDANVPLLGTVTVFDDSVATLSEGADFDCGSTYLFRAFIGDSGMPRIEVEETTNQ